MRDPYFHRLYETPADQGVADEPVDDVELEGDAGDAGDDVGGEAEEPRYSMSEIAEQLGPRFAERYLEPHGENALAEYGRSFESTLGLVGRGAHREPQDEELYRSLGLEPPEPPADPAEGPMPLYGAPWAEPQSWDELVELAERNPRAAAEFALGRDDLPDQTKAWFFANWASVDAAGVFEYNQRATTQASQAYADQVRAEMRAEVEPLLHDRQQRHAETLVTQAAQAIPGFSDHSETVARLMAERQQRDDRYRAWFVGAPLQTQLEELRDLTGIAVFRNQPAAEAEAEETLAATEAAKTRAKTETARTGGSAGGRSAQSALKKHNLEQFQKLKDQGVI